MLGVLIVNPGRLAQAAQCPASEGATCGAATTGHDILNNSILVTLGGTFGIPGFGPTSIMATFTPNLGLTLTQAEQDLGIANFEWVQTITNLPAPSPYQANNFPGGPPTTLTAPLPFNDPPPGGGYTYELTNGYPNGDFSYPFYYNINTELPGQETAHSLMFYDAPADPTLPAGGELAFTTELVGVLTDFQLNTDCLALLTCIDLGEGFSWTDNFNGTSGGTATTKNSLPVDVLSGTGRITIISIDGIKVPEPSSIIALTSALSLFWLLRRPKPRVTGLGRRAGSPRA
jgi:hypothetical protein